MDHFGFRLCTSVMRRVAFALPMLATSTVFGATITVNSTADVVANDGQCTLREAIVAANNNAASGAMAGECAAGEPLPTLDNIVFNIAGAGVHTITPATALPGITQGVVIDGGNGGVAANRVQLSGGGTLDTGLSLGSVSSVTLRNLVINGFTSRQIQFIAVTSTNVEGNFIGLDAAGASIVAGSGIGIDMCCSSSGNLIGGTSASARNVISSANSFAVALDASNATIQGNYIGLNASGTARVGNPIRGISVYNSGATIGGTVAGAGNVITAPTGIAFDGNGALSPSNGTVKGNFIGTDAAGTTALNAGSTVGINIAYSNSVLISGGNVISGNQDGITFTTFGPAGVAIQGNFIGTAADGVTALGNSGLGIDMFYASSSRIGGINAGEGNVIAYNGDAGVRNGNATGIPILGNSIFSNGALGISLSGGSVPTPNDAGDGDTGANNLQNYPVLGAVSAGGGNVLVSGSLNSSASKTYRLEFFASPACDASGHGEGKTLLGSSVLATDAGGNATFTNLSFPAAGGPVITATATVEVSPGTYSDTSEFSNCLSLLVPTLDVDDNKAYDALTDGLIVIRYLFGLTGDPMIHGAVAPDAQRTTAAGILAYLDAVKPQLDVDGNGSADALTDGLMMLRYLFGLRGTALISGAVGPGAIRTGSAQIETYLQTLLPP